jgi:hypothetical protein
MTEQELQDAIAGRVVVHFPAELAPMSLRLSRQEAQVFEYAKQQGYLVALTRQRALRYAWEAWCEIKASPCCVILRQGQQSQVETDLVYLVRKTQAGRLTQAGIDALKALCAQHSRTWYVDSTSCKVERLPLADTEPLLQQIRSIYQAQHD